MASIASSLGKPMPGAILAPGTLYLNCDPRWEVFSRRHKNGREQAMRRLGGYHASVYHCPWHPQPNWRCDVVAVSKHGRAEHFSYVTHAYAKTQRAAVKAANEALAALDAAARLRGAP
jgi:hypothetical protein